MKLLDRARNILCLLLIAMQCSIVRAQVNVTTYHNDNARTGQYAQETTLNPSNVNSSQFGRLFTINVDGYVYAQPLYLSNVVINGGTHNVLYVATEHDSLYAIDADTGLVYWAISLIATGGTTVSSSSDLGCSDLVPEVGITGTPVIDGSTGTLYVVAKSKVSGTIVQYLHAIDVVTGADKFGGPTLIQATAPGTAGDGNGTTVTFNAKWENQRAGLLLDNGHVIIGWSAHCDISPWHGWIMSYGAGTLAQEAAFNTSPNGYANGVWMAGAGIAADAAGNIYFATGNGSWNGTTDFGNSIVKLGLPSGHAFPILDYFTPFDQVNLTNNDLDVASGGLILLPPLPSGQQLLVQQSKVGKIFVIDTASMGKYCVNLTPACTSSDTNIVQEIPGATTGIWGAPAYWNGSVYWSGGNDNDGSVDSIKAFSFNAGGSGLLSTTPTSQSTAQFGFSSPVPAVSSNGTLDGILWGLDNSNLGTCNGTVNCQALYAYDATNLQTMLYNSNQAAGYRDVPGGAVKFTTPIVANGKVFFGSQKSASAYGLLGTAAVTAKPTFSPGAGTYTAAQSVSIADSTPGATILYTTDGTYPTVTSTTYTGPIQVTGTTTIHAIAIAPGDVTSSMASGTYTITAPAASTPTFSPAPGTYSSTQSVTLSDSTPGAVIYYTTDGSTPNTTTSPTYNGPIQVAVTTTIKALAYAAGYSSSSVATGTWTITAPPPPPAATPTFSLAAGSYSSTQTVTISDSTPGATIYYTTDGSTPNPASSPAYSSPVQINAPTTLNAIAAASGYSNSAVASRTYNVILPSTTYGIPLTKVANVYAVVSDGTAVPGTGVDGGGHAYSYVLLGPTPAWSGNTYDIGSPGTPNGATSTTIAFPPGQFATMSMLAAGFNGAQVGQSFVVTYTDSTTSTFTQSLSDWHSPQGYTGESNAFPNAYRVNPDGSLFNSTYYLYGYSFTLDPTKTVQSLTLPANANVVVVAVDATSTGAAATPTFSPPPGTYSSTQGVTLADTTPGATLYYTTDGTTPTSASTPYSGAITLSATTTINAIAVASGYTNSAVASGTYTISLPVAATPTFSPAPGTYASAQSVTLSDTTPGAQLYYTLDGTTPTAASTLYTGSIAVSATMTIKAIAVASGYQNSAIASGTYTISLPVAATPTFSPAPGTYVGTQAVSLSDSTPGALIYYSLDGSTPTTSSSLYVNGTPLQISSTTTINAIAVASGYQNSSVATGTYTITALPVAATPSASPPPGTYVGTQAVSLSDSTPGALIYYTLDGSTPTTSSSLYVNGTPLQISVTTTINAIAVASGYQNSSVATGTYTITALPVAATPSASPPPGTYVGTQAVSLSDSTPGALIYYTLDGSTPTTSSSLYVSGTPLQISSTTTINAIAAASGYQNSAVATGTYTITALPVAATPSANPLPGTYVGAQAVSLSDSTPGALIYYTLDGSTPTASSSLYVSGTPLQISSTTTINAIAVASGYQNSSIATGTYTITALPVAATPTFSPAPGTYVGTQAVSLSDSTPGALIYYTLDGSTPTTSSSLYVNGTPLQISSTTTINAIAVASGYTNSAVATGTYTITALPVAATPSANPPPGTYVGAQAVSLSDSTPGALIYYTLDGSTPTASSSLYVNGTPLQISVTTTIKAIAVASGYQNSAVATGTYTITALPVAATPTFSPAPGTYVGTQAVSLSNSTPGALIYYTLDGTIPTTSSSLYVNGTPLQISVTTTINAIAVASGYQNSAIATGTYTITALPVAAMPTASPPPGTYVGTQAVSLSDSTPGALIYYTLDGSTPTTSSSLYVNGTPLQISSTTTINAIAVASGYTNSAVATATFTITALPVAAMPTASPPPGTYVGTQAVSLSDSTPGALIYYTLDGSTPTTSSSLYVNGTPLQISSTTTINAIAVASGYTNSAVATGTYTITAVPIAATPTFSPVPGPYASAQTVTLTDGTPGAVIYYTTDGSVPTQASSQYVSGMPLQVGVTTTINAIAVASGYQDSLAATGTFTIVPPFTTSTVNLASTAGLYAVVDDGSPVPGSGIDGSGHAYSANLLGANPAWGDVTFTLGTPGTRNGASNTTIPLPAGTYLGLYLLATAVNGNQSSQPFVVDYTDGTSVTFTQGLSDWHTPQGFVGESTAFSNPYEVNPDGSSAAGTNYLYGYSFALDGTRSVKDLVLPPDGNVVVIAVDLTALVPAAAPTFSPAPGSYGSAQSVAMSDATPGASIYYTLDGSTPSAGSSKYVPGTPVPVSATTTVKAIAIAPGYADSTITTGTYTIVLPVAATPAFSPAPGTYTSAQSVSLTDATPGASIYYTTDGTTPTGTSNLYTGAIPVGGSTTIRAIAIASGYVNSAVATATYTISVLPPAATPTFTPIPGAYATAQAVSLADTTPGAVIHYTTDGSTPTSASAVYGAALQINSTTTIQAIAVAPGYANSAIAVGTYTINSLPVTATPTFSPAPGSFSSPTAVTLVDATVGAVIYYTTDGSTPTASSSIYSAPLPISATTTISMIAVAAGYAASPTVSGTFVINGPTAAAAPTFSVPAGTYTSAQVVALGDATPGAIIHFTTDGTAPNANSAVYSSPLQVSATTTITAIAIAAGYTNSAAASATYVISQQTAAPTFSPPPGTYAAAQTVVISDALPGAVIHFTLDGSTPTTASPVYTNPLQVATTTTINAIAVAPGYAPSAVVSATYTDIRATGGGGGGGTMDWATLAGGLALLLCTAHGARISRRARRA